MSEINETLDGIGERLMAAARPFVDSDQTAKEVTVAFLKQLDEEVYEAEEDNADWPCGGDFMLVATSLIPDADVTEDGAR